MEKEPLFRDRIISRIKVSKILISLGITISTLLGYLISHPYSDTTFWLTAISSLLLCSGSGALNNYQDRNMDRLFRRTSGRPLPIGSIAAKDVLLQAAVMIAAGITGFFFTKSPLLTVMLAASGIVLYNGVYTPLKSRTILAIIPGAICGMIPPAMGWSAAGAVGSTGEIVWLMAILGIWQLPHFWAILMIHADDYAPEQSDALSATSDSYQEAIDSGNSWEVMPGAAIPSMLTLFSKSQLERIMLVWSLLYGTMLIMVPLSYHSIGNCAVLTITLNGSAIFIFFIFRHLCCRQRNYSLEFTVLNLSLILSLFSIIADILAG